MGIEKMLADDGDMILCVDDDMRLPSEYLRILIAEMKKRNADVACGKMKLVYEDGQVRPSRWASLFARRNILPTNGSLVAASILRDYNVRFDERSMFGYENADFFYRANLCGAQLFLLEHPYFFGVRRKIEKKDELKYYMDARQERTVIRKYRGGWYRGVAYVLRRGIPLILQIIANFILLPFSLRKKAKKFKE